MKACKGKKDFISAVDYIETGYNQTYHTMTEEIPLQIVKLRKNRRENYNAYKDRVEKMNQKVIRKSEQRNTNTNEKRKEYDFMVGDEILVRKEKKDKLDEAYEGPFTIITISANNQSVEAENERKIIIRNIKAIKPFFPRESRMRYPQSPSKSDLNNFYDSTPTNSNQHTKEEPTGLIASK